ncbi:MAG: endonuclease/exonuclease/phosphatase family protein [Prevotella sp.]|jgi:endonuclease/exonuclease/phosphatase family metal-dependent hydrolase
MTYKLKHLLACLLLLLPIAMRADNAHAIDVMTFNVRLDVASDGVNAWTNRKADVGLMLRYYSPDLIGMQEVRPNQLTDLRSMMTDYGQVGVGRDDGKDAGEHCPIFYNKKRFTLLKHGDFALGEDTKAFGQKAWDASYPRMATWVIVKDQLSGKQLAYVNTHLDNDGRLARVEGIRLVLSMMKKLAPGLPLIVTGDFNCTEQEPLDVLRAAGMVNTREASPIVYGPAWSFHDFGRLPIAQRELLDYIFVSPDFTVDRYRVVDDKPDTHWLSDHCPVMGRILLK